MYLLTLLAAALAIALIFIVPKRAKVWVATALIAMAAIGAIALSAKTLLCGDLELASFTTSLFGKEQISVDGISALFLSIIAIA